MTALDDSSSYPAMPSNLLPDSCGAQTSPNSVGHGLHTTVWESIRSKLTGLLLEFIKSVMTVLIVGKFGKHGLF